MLQTRIKNRLVRRGIVALALLATLLGCTTNGGTTDERRSSTPVVAEQTFDEAEAAFGRGDYATAMEGFRVHAEQGNATAQFYLGLVYENGVVGVPEDDAEAVKWFRKAAEQGDSRAQYSLGVMYAKGEGVPKNDAEAAKWFRKAAEDVEWRLLGPRSVGGSRPSRLKRPRAWSRRLPSINAPRSSSRSNESCARARNPRGG